MTDTSTEILGKHREKKKKWITNELMDMCDLRRELKKTKCEPGSTYKQINNTIKKEMRIAKEIWINNKCTDIGECLIRNNTKKAYQIVNELTKKKDKIIVNVHDKDGKCITDKTEVLKRWTEYCSELYTHNAEGDISVLTVNEPSDQDNFPILESEVEAAIQALKMGKSAGIDNIPAELIKAGGHIVIQILLDICNKIWETGIWPSDWTKSMIISLHKKGSKQKCENYRTISLISHSSKIMLKIILNRLKNYTEEFISEEQAGFRTCRSTSTTIQHLYNKAESAVYVDGQIGEWFRTTTGVRQGCLLSPTLFNILLEQIMNDALDNHVGSVSIGGKIITNLRFADDIDGLAGSESELANLIKIIDNTARAYGMEINSTKTQIMTNSEGRFTSEIKINNEPLKVVDSFKYLGAIIDDKGSKAEILARTGQTIAALSRLNVIWYDKTLKLKMKIRLLQSLVNSIFLYACETWTITKELQRKITTLEMRCLK